MEVSIIINNFNTRGLLKQCIRGILQFPPSVEYEIIVVDNNSYDGSAQMVGDEFPAIKLIASKENLGHHKGNNLGMKNSTGKYVLIVNTDIAVLDNAFDKMYQYMESHPDCALLGPRLKNPDGSTQMSCMHFPTKMTPIYRRTFLGGLPWAKKELGKYLMVDFDHSQISEVDWILGACQMVRRAAIEKAGYLDEYLFLYFGDVAWCKKFWQVGYKVCYFPEAEIIHYHKRESANSGLFSRIFWIHIIDWVKFLNRYSKDELPKRV
ncbi:MAG: glycosyltransferase family 2 protein [Candidatus Buchananbacteria bacterium]